MNKKYKEVIFMQMKIVTLRTKNGSKYLEDLKKHVISGGKLGKTVLSYETCTILVGMPGIFKLSDGKTLKTSEIVDYGPSLIF